MRYGTQNPYRRTHRLRGYDYSASGAYFITICTHDRECLFGEVVAGEMNLSEIGEIVHEELLKTSKIRPEVQLDEFVIMPNHIHVILILHSGCVQSSVSSVVGTRSCASLPLHRQPRSAGSIVAGFKSAATTRINQKRMSPGLPVWQSRFHDRIIRNPNELELLREYVRCNPQNWHIDAEHTRS